MDDVAKDLARERLKADLKKAKSRRSLAWESIQKGNSPEYVAMRYGFTLDEMQKAKSAHEQQENDKRERLQARQR